MCVCVRAWDHDIVRVCVCLEVMELYDISLDNWLFAPPRQRALKDFKPDEDMHRPLRDMPHAASLMLSLGDESQHVLLSHAPLLHGDRYTQCRLLVTHHIVLGLQAMHGAGLNGVVHRDLKPANCLLRRGGEHGVTRVVLTDFGLARTAWRNRNRRMSAQVGTARYMAPEVIKGDLYGKASDIWSLGVTLYELWTGELSYNGDRLWCLLLLLWWWCVWWWWWCVCVEECGLMGWVVLCRSIRDGGAE